MTKEEFKLLLDNTAFQQNFPIFFDWSMIPYNTIQTEYRARIYFQDKVIFAEKWHCKTLLEFNKKIEHWVQIVLYKCMLIAFPVLYEELKNKPNILQV